MTTKYITAERMKYKPEEVWFPLAESVVGWDMDFHELMLNDHIRMTAYQQAISKTVKPGMVVVDIGTGTGILSLWALEAGASKVYGIDLNKEISSKAVQRITKAGFADKFKLFNELSLKVELPEKADIIISEILGNVADNEDMVPILNDARQRFLKQDGVMLPEQVQTYLVPITSITAHKQVVGRDFHKINDRYSVEQLLKERGTTNQFNMMYDAIFPENTYLGSPQLVQQFNFEGADEAEYEKKVDFLITESGTFTGFKGYFVAKLGNGVILDISGGDIENRTTADCWKHAYLPVETPFEVQQGDTLKLAYSRYYVEGADKIFKYRYSWTGNINREGVEIYTFSQKM